MSGSEYARFTDAKFRSLCLPEEALRERLGGKRVLVTGGTGCIGSALMAQLAPFSPSLLASVSRGVTAGWPETAGAVYVTGDVRSRSQMRHVVSEVRPDIIFHLAAVRSPALAEVEVQRTVTTNVLGTRNVLTLAAMTDAQVVYASTGKALRPYSPEVYSASKRAAEWVCTLFSGFQLVSATRFTHVADNSIIHDRLLEWAGDESAVVRLHSDSIGFYVQSALESAQLLLIALVGAVPGQLRVHAITDLGWPVSLTDMTRDLLAAKQSRTPVEIVGYEPGYEEVPFPGLYDPATAGDVSPLLNAFEAACVTDSPCPQVDAFTLEMGPVDMKLLGNLSTYTMSPSPAAIRRPLDALSWALLDATLAAADRTALSRSARLLHLERMTHPVHQRIAEAIARAVAAQ